MLPVLALVAIEAALRLVGYGHAGDVDRPLHRQRPRILLRQRPLHVAVLPRRRIPAAAELRVPRGEAREHLSHFRHRRIGSPGRPRALLFVLPLSRGDAARSLSGAALRGRQRRHHRSQLPCAVAAGPRSGAPRGDLFIVYAGNNEVVGPFGAGNTFTRTARASRSSAAACW